MNTRGSFTSFTLGFCQSLLEKCLHFLLFRGFSVPLGDGLIQKLVDGVDHVRSHQCETTETATVHHTNSQRRTIHLLLRQFCNENTVSSSEILYYIRNAVSLPMSRNLTKVVKLGFFLAFIMTEDWMICPAHSMSTRGLSTVNQWILLRSRRPQNKTSNLRKKRRLFEFFSFLKKRILPVFGQSWANTHRNW